ncbi:MAG: tryptophan 2,3-dioxygenase [Bacteroidia bacterium]|nr:tryptophan 2,3-dioxygenase [Bacteroidia bacterium]
MELTPEILSRLEQLEKKYASMGQDMVSYLDGLLYSNSLTYWEYIHLDTLLSLQNPQTDFEDEPIFIMYHQITELYFRLILRELEALCLRNEGNLADWLKRIRRVVNYFKNLASSFDVMVEGMESAQFLKFRMALLPASGFQSVQYRMIEVASTSLGNLVKTGVRDRQPLDATLEELYNVIYWKYGNIEMKTGKKTLTLRIFEKEYDKKLLEMAATYRHQNVNQMYLSSHPEVRENVELKEILREYDLYANVFWPLSHYKSAVRYLDRAPEVIEATGGTNWQKYLPPQFQKVMFFPELWSEEEKNEWGKAGILRMFREKVETRWGKIH